MLKNVDQQKNKSNKKFKKNKASVNKNLRKND